MKIFVRGVQALDKPTTRLSPHHEIEQQHADHQTSRAAFPAQEEPKQAGAQPSHANGQKQLRRAQQGHRNRSREMKLRRTQHRNGEERGQKHSQRRGDYNDSCTQLITVLRKHCESTASQHGQSKINFH